MISKYKRRYSISIKNYEKLNKICNLNNITKSELIDMLLENFNGNIKSLQRNWKKNKVRN